MLDVEVSDITRVDPFVNRLILDVEGQSSSLGGGGGGTRRRGTNTGNGRHGTSGNLALPEVKRVREAEWQRLSFHPFTEDTALAIVRPDADDDDVFDFYVNVDNKYVRAVQKDSRDDPKLLEEKFVYSMVLVGLALVMDHSTKKADRRDAGPEENIEGLVSRVTGKLAPVILPMVDVVGGLSLESLHDDE